MVVEEIGLTRIYPRDGTMSALNLKKLWADFEIRCSAYVHTYQGATEGQDLTYKSLRNRTFKTNLARVTKISRLWVISKTHLRDFVIFWNKNSNCKQNVCILRLFTLANKLARIEISTSTVINTLNYVFIINMKNM